MKKNKSLKKSGYRKLYTQKKKKRKNTKNIRNRKQLNKSIKYGSGISYSSESASFDKDNEHQSWLVHPPILRPHSDIEPFLINIGVESHKDVTRRLNEFFLFNIEDLLNKFHRGGDNYTQRLRDFQNWLIKIGIGEQESILITQNIGMCYSKGPPS